jgi:uncharacterized protein (UPF0276 family)
MDLPKLGVGLGYRQPYHSDLFMHRASVDFLEITADHFLHAPAAKKEQLQQLKRNFTLIPHGLDLSLGSAEGPDEAYLKGLAQLVNMLDPPWWSEHIAFTRSGGVELGHLAPVPFRREALDILCHNVEKAQQKIKAPLILENITYSMKMPGAHMTEGEFLRTLVERTGVGLLLDVTNLFINSQNHGYDPNLFLDELPPESVVQLHFVGYLEQKDHFVDTHSEPTQEPVWELLAEVFRRFPVKGAILERDENLPPFEELADELQRARKLMG